DPAAVVAGDDAPADREVVVPEIVAGPQRWASPPPVEATTDTPPDSDVEVVDARQPASPPSLDLPARTRAVRITKVKTNGKRRWVVDVLVKQPDGDDTRT